MAFYFKVKQFQLDSKNDIWISILAKDIERIFVLRMDQILINNIPKNLESNFSTEIAYYVMHLLKLLSTLELTV